MPVELFRQATEFIDDSPSATHNLPLLDVEQSTNTNTIVEPESKPDLTFVADQHAPELAVAYVQPLQTDNIMTSLLRRKMTCP